MRPHVRHSGQGFLQWIGTLAVAFALVAAPGCREITDPLPLLDDEPISLLILGTDGSPADRPWVQVSNHGYLPDQWRSWSDYASEDGVMILDPALPKGTYWVRVSSFERDGPDWVEPRVELRGGMNVLDPRPRLTNGTVSVPEEFRSGSFRVEFTLDLDLDTGPVGWTLTSPVDPEGRFEFVPVPETSAWVVLEGWGAETLMHEALISNPGDTLHLTWEPVRLEVRLTLAGMPLPAGRVRLQVKAPRSEVDQTFEVLGPTIEFVGAEGPGTLRVRPEDMPFLPRTVPIEWIADEVPTVELGNHTVNIELFTTTGQPLYGADLRLDEGATGESVSFNRVPGSITVYLRTGSYLLRGGGAGYVNARRFVDVQSDMTVRLELEPSLTGGLR